MKITKYGHACLLVEEGGGASLLIDPGSMSILPALSKLDAILITHEHGDHFDIEKIKTIRAEHPEVQILTQVSVGKILDAEGIVRFIPDVRAIVGIADFDAAIGRDGIRHIPRIGGRRRGYGGAGPVAQSQ